MNEELIASGVLCETGCGAVTEDFLDLPLDEAPGEPRKCSDCADCAEQG